jgi:ABC-2 type transport system permease protein
MKKAFLVGKWEYLEKVKTKTFLISLILTPIIIILFSIAPTLLSKQIENSTKPIGVIDSSGLYFNYLRQLVDRFRLANGQPNYILINLTDNSQKLFQTQSNAEEYVLSGKIDAFLVIKNGGTNSIKAEIKSNNTLEPDDILRLKYAVEMAKNNFILSKEGISASIRNSISEGIDFKVIKINDGKRGNSQDFSMLFLSTFVYILLLTMMILTSGGMLIRSLVEEKSNRLIEILISSCTPDELLTGKIIGLSSLGLTQVIIWTLIAISIAILGYIPLQVFNNLIPVFIYFILGFIFYTAIFVGIGSIVSSEQEAQQITSYLSFVLILPIVLTVPALENPNSMFVHILSVIPFTIPSIMILRFNIGNVPPLEVIASSIIMLISIYTVVGMSSKIFHIGILSYGKRPSLKEIIEWIK